LGISVWAEYQAALTAGSSDSSLSLDVSGDLPSCDGITDTDREPIADRIALSNGNGQSGEHCLA